MNYERLAIATVIGLACSLAPKADAAKVYTYAVTQFGDSGECDSSNLTWTTWQADYFRNQFDSDWTKKEFKNQDVDGRDFTDSSKDDYTGNGRCTCSDSQGSCACLGEDGYSSYGADDATVVFLSTHGGNGERDDGTDYFYYKMGDDTNDCNPTSYGNLMWNDTAAIVAVDACHSLQYSVWNETTGDRANDPLEIVTSSSDLSTYLGYHGTAPDRTTIKSFAKNSFSNDIGENWLSYQYEGSSDADEDTCPVAMIFGSSKDNRKNMYDNGGFEDRKDTGDKTGWTAWYFEGCDPDGGDPLPND